MYATNNSNACAPFSAWFAILFRYCQELLTGFLDRAHSRKTLAQAVAEARSACRMQYIVGCSPVYYGVPVEVLSQAVQPGISDNLNK